MRLKTALLLGILVTWSPLVGALAIGLGPPVHAEQQAPSFEDIVQKLTLVNGALRTFQADQDVDVRWLIFRFRLTSTVYAARPAKYKLVLHNPPWILRQFGTAYVQVARPEDVLVQYGARTIAWKDESGRRLLYLELARAHPGVNPPTLEAFIDPTRWLVERLNLHFAWGTVIAEYEYGLIREFVLPSRIRLHTSSYPFAAAMTFRDFQLNVPIPDAVFDSK